MIDLPPPPKKERVTQTSERTKTAVRFNLKRGREVIDETPEDDFDAAVAEMFYERITDEEMERERGRLRNWSHAVLSENREVLDRLTLGEVTKRTATTAVAMNRARNFWRQGLELTEGKDDLDTWLRIVSSEGFARTADRAAIYPEESLPSDTSIATRMGGKVSGALLQETILRLGEDDQEYLREMGIRIASIAASDDSAGLSHAMRSVARGFIRNSRVVAEGDNERIAEEMENPRDLKRQTEMEPALFLAHAAVKHERRIHADRPPRTPSEALEKIDFLVVTPKAKETFEKARVMLEDALAQEDSKDHTRDPVDFVRGGSRLLLSALGFAASPEGARNINAGKMYRFLADKGGHQGHQPIPSRRAIVALANQVTPLLKTALQDPNLKPLDVTRDYDTYLAMDRLFAFIEYDILNSPNPHPEAAATLDVVADCALQLADHGLRKIILRTIPENMRQSEDILPAPLGSKARLSALHGLRQPGSSKLSQRP